MEETIQKFIKTLKSDDFYMYVNNEFYNLKEYSNKLVNTDAISSDFGELDCNHFKNRYKDILPFDKCRVKLDSIDNIEGSDYINASFIKGVENSYSYIGAQAPLKSTASDFIRMIWQYNIKVLICACNEYEGNKPKCFRYWPNDQDEILNFDKIEAKLIHYEEDSSNEFVIREILLKRTNIVDDHEFTEERVLTQFHMINWPDHGVPDNIDPIIQMLDYVHFKLNESLSGENQHLVVHCSAGCGRTGTIIALDYCWNLISTGQLPNDFSPFKIGKMLREQRTAMIQTFDQYKMFYESLEYLLNKKFLIKQPENSKDNTVEEISQQQNNNQRISSSGSKKGSIKKVIDSLRPSSSSSTKSKSNKISNATDLPKERASSTNSLRNEKYECILSNINSNLPVLHREPLNNAENSPRSRDVNNNSFFDNSQENFDFKPIPKERFNKNFQILSSNEADDFYKSQKINDNNIVIKDVDDDFEIDDKEENFEPIVDSKLVVHGIAESIFGQVNNMNNTPIAKLKHNSSLSKLKLEDTNVLPVDRKQSRSATVVLSGVIELQTSHVTDLLKENPPKKAQLSTNLKNPSPPVSARNNYGMKKSNDQELNNLKYSPVTTPTPPPRNKHRNNLLNEVNNTNNSSPQNTHYISETEHLV